MPHAYRFYMPPAMPTAGTIALPPEEAHHAARVVRVRPGDIVELFDGEGRICEALVEEVTKRDVLVRIVEATAVEAARTRLALLQAWPNHEKTAESIIRRATELGATTVAFFRGDHSERAPKASEKWTKLAIESAKQCRRAWLPKLEAWPTLSEAQNAMAGSILVATMERAPVPVAEAADDDDLVLVIGPEGDLSEHELEMLLSRGAKPISLGERILRSEIAVTVALALIQYERGELGL